LNNPPTPGSQSGRGGSNLGSVSNFWIQVKFHYFSNHLFWLWNTGSERDLQSLLSSMSQQQLMQLFGNVGGMSGLSSLLVPSDGYHI
jgi:hypothetical protein